MRLLFSCFVRSGYLALLVCASSLVAIVVVDDMRATNAEETIRSHFGSYLSGRFASRQRDTLAAAKFYRKALREDPKNEVILEQAFLLEAAGGHWQRSYELARKLIKKDPSHRIAHTFLGVRAVKAQKYSKADTHFSAATRGPIAELTSTLSRGWVFYARGRTDKALALLQKRSDTEWVNFYKKYHLGLIADLAGNREVAKAAFEEIFRKDERALRVASAYARFAANTGDFELAEKILQDHLKKASPHPESEVLLEMVKNKQRPTRIVRNSQDGVAEVYYGLGDALTAESDIDVGLIYLQLALYARQDFPLALASLAHVYETTKKYSLALETYNKINDQAPIWARVQIRKAFNMSSLDKVDEAKKLLEDLAGKYPKDIRPLDALGDILRSRKRFKEASTYYSRAIDLIKTPEKTHWSLYYSRGVCFERMKDWPSAEKDLELALSLDGDQPLILNYLGYSWVDQNVSLDKAMTYIRKAVRLKPDDGYFVDSLGWAYYRQNKFEDATRHLERAVELRPDDPVINDHLGDAYWMVGRRVEARYQWSQSLTLSPEPEEVAKIRKKLKEGLTGASEVKAVSKKTTGSESVPK